jgi:hypothetical protein
MYKPEVVVQKEWIHSGEDNEAELICIINAKPEPIVTWFKDGTKLDFDEIYWAQAKQEKNQYKLLLRNLKRDQFGTYLCRAMNSVGVSEGVIELSGMANKVHFKSDPNGRHAHTYKLTWTVDSCSPILEYDLMYRKVQCELNDTCEWVDITVPGETQDDGPKHAVEWTLHNLSPATEYEVSIQVVNSFGKNQPTYFKFATLGSSIDEDHGNGDHHGNGNNTDHDKDHQLNSQMTVLPSLAVVISVIALVMSLLV